LENIAVFLANGFEEIEAVSIIDILRRANLEVTIISITGKTEVKGSHNIVINADLLFEDVNFNKVDMIVLPGGMPGAKNLNNHEGLKKQIIQFNQAGKPLAAICAAPLVYGQLGILKGKKATCFPGFEDYLMNANITNSKTQVDGNIITGKGAGVAIDFALKIVEMLRGKDIAQELAQRMIAD